MKKCLILIFMLCLALPVFALQQLNFKGFIADEANLLSDDVKNDLNMTLWDLQKKTGADIAVVILKSLDGDSVENTALEIGRKYKIGSKQKNNGVVFLTALNERQLRIELGYGLEDKISISTLQNIIDYDILPYYKQNDYQNGIVRGTYKLVDKVAQVEGVSVETKGYCPNRVSTRKCSGSDAPWWLYPFAIFMAIISPRRRRSFGYGSFSGFGGGGGFGGSGCSGRW